MQYMRTAQTLLNKFDPADKGPESFGRNLLRVGALLLTASSDRDMFKDLNHGIEVCIQRLVQLNSNDLLDEPGSAFPACAFDEAMKEAAKKASTYC